MADLIVEFRSEEIPARMQRRAREDLVTLFRDALGHLGITPAAEQTFVTPRRLTYAAQGLPVATPDRVEEKRGPRIDAPAQALEGFLRQTGLSSLDECEQRDTGKGIFYFALSQQKGQPLADLLPGLIEDIVSRFPWPKSMRWGKGNRTWVRPLSAGLCVFDGRPVTFTLSMNKEALDAPQVVFGGETVGHRFMERDAFAVDSLAAYQEGLKQRFVMVDQDARRDSIKAQVAKRAQEKGLSVWQDQGLEDEVTGLVEWPVAYLGAIEPKFLALPREVLMTVMRVHQRYFALQDHQGHLAPWFVVVANIEAKDGGATLVDGNERVLKARFSDAHFFYQQDLKTPLGAHARGLENIVFHKDLGLMSAKVQRLQNLSRWLAPFFDVNPDQAAHAAALAKADLTTHMVGEFPELQGIMGRIYALAQGESAEVATAIEEHYLPRGAQDHLPATPLGRVLALADRLDTLVGFFALNIR
ncbi:MAG: glycine--tRNA ligase subunit beta, partial [Holosporales bacterium]